MRFTVNFQFCETHTRLSVIRIDQFEPEILIFFIDKTGEFFSGFGSDIDIILCFLPIGNPEGFSEVNVFNNTQPSSLPSGFGKELVAQISNTLGVASRKAIYPGGKSGYAVISQVLPI